MTTVINIIVSVQNDNGQSAHEGHELTLQEGERFAGIAYVLINDRDETDNAQHSKPIKVEDGILLQ